MLFRSLEEELGGLQEELVKLAGQQQENERKITRDEFARRAESAAF